MAYDYCTITRFLKRKEKEKGQGKKVKEKRKVDLTPVTHHEKVIYQHHWAYQLEAQNCYKNLLFRCSGFPNPEILVAVILISVVIVYVNTFPTILKDSRLLDWLQSYRSSKLGS